VQIGLPAAPSLLPSNPTDLAGQVDLQSTYAYAVISGNSPNAIGTFSNNTGTTNFSAKFTLNGNYGSALFTGTANGIESSLIAITVSGETYEDAINRVIAYKMEVSNHFNSLASKYRSRAADCRAWSEVLLWGAGVIFLLKPEVAIACVILAFILDRIAAFLDYAATQALLNADQWLQELDEILQPILDGLPKFAQ